MGDFTRLADLMRSGLDLDAALRKLDRTTPTHILPASLGVTTGTPAGGTSFNNILSFTNDLDYEIAEEADTLRAEANRLDPNVSKAFAVPGEILFSPPDEVSHYHSYFFRPF